MNKEKTQKSFSLKSLSLKSSKSKQEKKPVGGLSKNARLILTDSSSSLPSPNSSSGTSHSPHLNQSSSSNVESLTNSMTGLDLAALYKDRAINAFVESPRYSNVYIPYEDGILHLLEPEYEGDNQLTSTPYCYLCSGRVCSNHRLSIKTQMTGTRKNIFDSIEVSFPVYRKLVIGNECFNYIQMQKQNNPKLVVQIDSEYYSLYVTSNT